MDYRDASLPIPERVQNLLERMTTEEKIGQLIQPMGWKTYRKESDGTVQVTEEFKENIAQGGVGSLYGVLRADPWTEVTLETGLTPGQERLPPMKFSATRLKTRVWAFPFCSGKNVRTAIWRSGQRYFRCR